MGIAVEPNVNVIQGNYFDGWDANGYQVNVHFHNESGGSRNLNYTISLQYAIQNEVVNDDNSISFDFGGLSAIAINSTYLSPSSVNCSLTLQAIDNGGLTQVFNESHKLSDVITFYKQLTPKWERKTVAPSQSLDIPTYELAHWLNYVGPGVNDEFSFNAGGKAVNNNLPPLYRSRSISDGTTRWTLNHDGSWTKLYDNGWQDQARQNYGNINLANVGSRLIFIDGQYMPQTKTGE